MKFLGNLIKQTTLAALVLAMIVTPAVLGAEDWEVEYDEERAAVQAQIEKVENKLNSAIENIQNLQNRQANLADQISQTQAEIEELDNLITETKAAISAVQVEIDDNEKQIAQLKTRIIEVYREIQNNQVGSLIEVILSSNTLAEAIGKLSALSSVETELEALQGEIASEVKKLEANVELLEKTKKTQEDGLALSQSRKSELDNLLLIAEDEELEYEKEADLLADERSAYAAEAAQIDSDKAAEAARRAAEEEARRVAEQKRLKELEEARQAEIAAQEAAERAARSSSSSTSSIVTTQNANAEVNAVVEAPTAGTYYNYGATDPGQGDFNRGGCVQETVNYSGVPAGTFTNPTYGVITNGFGCVPWSVGYGAHDGVDLANGIGTQVVSMAAGTVVFSGYQGGFGYVTTIRHDLNGRRIYSTYAHLNTSPVVGVGEYVAQGQLVGYLGTSGYSTGPHLHFAIADESYEYSNNANCNPNYGGTYTYCLNPFQLGLWY